MRDPGRWPRAGIIQAFGLWILAANTPWPNIRPNHLAGDPGGDLVFSAGVATTVAQAEGLTPTNPGHTPRAARR